jgi:hypothetical protein
MHADHHASGAAKRTEVEQVVAAHLPRKGLDGTRVLHRVQQHHLPHVHQQSVLSIKLGRCDVF